MSRFVCFLMIILFPSAIFAQMDTETALQRLTGKWYGEVEGIYIIDYEAVYNKEKPWSLFKAKIDVIEGIKEQYRFTITRISNVYFLIWDVKMEQPKDYSWHEEFTLSSSEIGDYVEFIFSNLRIKPYDSGYREISSGSVILSLNNDEMTFGYSWGPTYRIDKEGNGQLFETRGYRPFILKKKE